MQVRLNEIRGDLVEVTLLMEVRAFDLEISLVLLKHAQLQYQWLSASSCTDRVLLTK